MAFALFIGLILIGTACQPQIRQSPGDATPFRPPTLSADTGFTPTALETAIPTLSTNPIATLRPSPTSPCTNILTYESDVTIPDGSKVKPGVTLDKQWQIKNTGTCNWDHTYALKLVDGDGLGVISDQALFPARAGSEAIIRLVFTAPAATGTYRSAWQAVAPDGALFGDPVFIEVVVKGP